jgi:hypothetical protein
VDPDTSLLNYADQCVSGSATLMLSVQNFKTFLKNYKGCRFRTFERSM